MKRNFLPFLKFALLTLCFSNHTLEAQTFVNFETPQTHPIDLSPDGKTLAVCNTDANRIELFETTLGTLIYRDSIAVGYNPTSIRFRTNDEAWVVNQISDSVSIVDIPNRVIKKTLATDDEPADLVFAGNPQKAYVSCSQTNTILAFDTFNPDAAPASISILGEDPRSMAVSPDGLKVYVAIFESGNRSTILGGDFENPEIINFPDNVVGSVLGPHGGVNPPPNSGQSFNPPLNTANPTPPKATLIVKKDDAGRWMDDSNGDWTNLVSGPNAAASNRIVGWDVIDNDLAVIDTLTNSVSYATGLMNICMGVSVNPTTGNAHVIGTDATNEVRFEPVINGRFLRVNMGVVSGGSPSQTSVVDLNPHLNYFFSTIPQSERDKSLGDPRGMAWNGTGNRGYVAGMGSNNLIVVDPIGNRIPGTTTIEVGEGPTGIVYDSFYDRLFILNRFDSSVSIVDLETEQETDRVPLFDPAPEAIKKGRKHLFDTHKTSGLGHVSCASCHVDTRTDRLSWDLGDPSGDVKFLNATHNLGLSDAEDFTDFHPMKGPMLTQTLQDIIGKEPLHWRGDRDGLEEFNGAFMSLLGDDTLLTDAEMQEFEDYLSTIHFPPNPFRNLDNSLPQNLPLPGHYTTGRFAAEGQPLPNGNAQSALTNIYRNIDRGIVRGDISCVTCHTLPTGMSPRARFILEQQRFVDDIPLGPNGEAHHILNAGDSTGDLQRQTTFKIPQLRSLYDRVGFDLRQPLSRAGFGFTHSGVVDSLARFFSEPAFEVQSDQEVADLVALSLAFSGSDFGPSTHPLDPTGTLSQDAHAAVGKQISRIDATESGEAFTLMDQLLSLADSGSIEVIAKSAANGNGRGWLYLGNGFFQSDEATIVESLGSLIVRATSQIPVTFMAVPTGEGQRMGIDRDLDGLLDYDETRDFLPQIVGIQNPFTPNNPDSTGNNGSVEPDGILDSQNDFDGDGLTNEAEIAAGSNPVDNLVGDVPDLNLFANLNTNDSVLVEWDAAPLGVYEIEFTTDLIAWKKSGSSQIQAPLNGGRLQWLDTGRPTTASSISQAEKRYYRVIRIK